MSITEAFAVNDTCYLSPAIKDYLLYIEHRKKLSRTSIATYESGLKIFLSVVGDLPLSKLNVEVVDKFAMAISIQGITAKTYRNKLVIVRSFIAYLYKYDKCILKPERIDLPKDKHTEANFLSPSEQKKLLKVVKGARDIALILTLLTSGVRVSELTDIRVNDLYKRSIAVRNGKGGKPRVTFITKEAQSAVSAYLNTTNHHDGYLFPNPHGDRLSRAIVARTVSNYAAKAGIQKKVTTHTLRHTMATNMLKKGARIEDVQMLLGHTNIRTTMIYLHFTNHDLEKAYKRIMG